MRALRILAEEARLRSPDHIPVVDLWLFARQKGAFHQPQLDHLVVCPTCVEIALLLRLNNR